MSVKKRSIQIIVVILLCLFFSGFAYSASNKPIKLLYGAIDHEGTIYAGVVKDWAKEIESKSNGMITVEYSWASALGPMFDYYKLLKSGICDMAWFIPAMGPGLFPVSEIPSLPWTNHNGSEAVRALYKLYENGFLDKEFADVKIVFLTAVQPSLIFTSVKKPVASLKDLKGLKIIAPSPSTAVIISSLDATPVMLPIMEAQIALQKGVTEGVFSSYGTLIDFGWMDYLDNAVTPGFGGVTGGVLMNKKTWNRLPENIQNTINEISEKYGMMAAERLYKREEECKNILISKGGRIHTFNQENLMEIEKRFSHIWSKFIDDYKKKGQTSIRKAIDIFYTSMKEQGISRPAIGYSPGD